MRINKDTAKFFSVASRPGNFGATLYNELFRLLGINAIYVPLGVDPKHGFARVFHGLEIIGARGINISMPFKDDARQHVYNCPEFANINTMVKDAQGSWNGYNTDAHGFCEALEEMVPIEELQTVAVFGQGAVAHTVVDALHQRNRCVLVSTSKDPPKMPVDLVVNATPVGMEGVEVKVPWDRFVAKAKYVFDAVISPPQLPTQLVRTARDSRKPYVEGQIMCKHGLARQFLYHFPHQDPEKVKHLIDEEMKAMGYAV